MNEDKRKLEKAEERQVGPKKQKNDDVTAVEEQKRELKTSEIDQEHEVSKSYVSISPEEELIVATKKIKPDDDTILEDEASGSPEDPGAPKNVPGSATRNGHVASIEKKDNASNGSGSVLEGEDVAATKNVYEALPSSNGANSNKMEGNSTSKEESEEAEPSNIKGVKMMPISFSENRSSSEEPPEEYDEVSTDRETEDPSGNQEKLVNSIMSELTISTAGNLEKLGDDVKVMDAMPTTENSEEGGSLPVEDPKNPATLRGQPSGSKTLFLGNLSFSIERVDVEEFFKDVGEIVDIQFAMNEDDTFRGFGHVEFATVEAAEKALQDLNGKHLLRRRLRLDFKREKGSYTRYSGTETSSNQMGGEAQGQRIFIRGFDKSHGEDKIRSALGDHFGSCGEITRISIPKDRDGGFKGIAYIDFKDADAFNNALELNGSEFGENTLAVEVARSRDGGRDYACSGSGRFGGRGDGGVGRGYGGRIGGSGRGYGGHFEGRGYGGYFEGGRRGYGGHFESRGQGYGSQFGGGSHGYGGNFRGGDRGGSGHFGRKSFGGDDHGYSGWFGGGGRGW